MGFKDGTNNPSTQKPPLMNQFVWANSADAPWMQGGTYTVVRRVRITLEHWDQMDLGFQKTYAPWLVRVKGTADHWTPLEQIWTAEKASRSRGFWPWPNTARFCGLI